jgi:putative two-component system response regulator
MNNTQHAAAAVLVVDDDAANVALIARMLRLDGYVVHTASDGEAALAALDRHAPDILLLDVQLPGLDGFEVCRRVKHRRETRLLPIVLVTGLHDRESRIKGINAGADDFLSKPFDAEELRARVRSLLRIQRYTHELESAESIILSLALTVEARDAYTNGHCERLARYAAALGRDIQLPEDDIAALHRGGYLHDVGKVGIPDAILQKSGKLSAAEYDVIKEHTTIGERLCGNLRSLDRVRPIVRHHHERLDGRGYPDRLHGDDVPLLAQVVSIADAYDAITTTRPYRRALPPEHAFAELRTDAAQGLRRPDLVEAFIALVRDGRLAMPLPDVAADRGARLPSPRLGQALDGDH